MVKSTKTNTQTTHFKNMLLNQRVRFFLYFLGLCSLACNYWMKAHQVLDDTSTYFSALNTLLPLSDHYQNLFTFGIQGFIAPSILALLFTRFESIFFAKHLITRQWALMFLSYFPLLVLLLGILNLCTPFYLALWPSKILFLSLMIILNGPLLLTQWKKTFCSFLGLVLIGYTAWTSIYIGKSTVNQLISTFIFGAQGMLTSSIDLMRPLIKFIVFYPLLITLFLIPFIEWGTKKIKSRRLQKIVPSMLIVVGLCGIANQYALPDFINQYYHELRGTHEDFFARNYKDPEKFQFKTKGQPKSLVLIYIESLDNSYQNKQIFGRNLLASLTDLKVPAFSFQNFQQMSGADWTIAAMVASQCGVPLKLISLFSNNDVGEHLTQFLPNSTCLGDVLTQLGYHNVFLKGASLQFSGAGTFFKTHHYQEILGKDEWLNKGYRPEDMLGWGLPDDLLFKEAKIKLDQLMKGKQPFNLTILTVDTHGPDGQISRTCAAHHGQKFEDIVECTANATADFVHYIAQQGWLDRVTVVVTGDHMPMANPVTDKLATASTHSIFNLIITADPLAKNRESIVHVDLFPTILEVLGIQWGSARLALGHSALAPLPPKLDNEERFKLIEKSTASSSSKYNSLWASKNRKG